MNASPLLRKLPPSSLAESVAQPVVDDLRVDRAEVGFEVDVAGVVLERRVARIGVEVRARCRRARR